MAHKIALDLNNHQRTYMLRATGVARFAYNWALEQWGIQYRAWREDDTLPKPSQFSLRKQLNEIKKESFPWMLEVCPSTGDHPAWRSLQELLRASCRLSEIQEEGRARQVQHLQ